MSIKGCIIDSALANVGRMKTSANQVLGVLALGLALVLAMSAHVEAAPETRLKNAPDEPVVFKMDGKIYPFDSFPAICQKAFQGVPCNEESFGMFKVEGKQEPDGSVHSVAVFSDSQGPQVTEESWELKGKLVKAKIHNRVLGTQSSVEVHGNKLIYKTQYDDGTTKVSDADAEPHLVVSTTLMAYLRPHFAKILAGEKVQIKLAVLDRRDSFTFNIQKIKSDQTLKGESVAVLEMSPASLIVKAVVDPVRFFINLNSGALFAFEGRSALRRKVGEKYKEMEVKTLYQTQIDVFGKQILASSSSNCGSGSTLALGSKYMNSQKCDVKSAMEGSSSESKKTVRH